MSLRLPKYLSKASGAGVALNAVGFPCSERHTDTPQKSERWEGSWPYDQNLIKTCNNQPEINDSGRRDVGERAHVGDNWDNKKQYKMNHAKA
jgi:hypothetical protein